MLGSNVVVAEDEVAEDLSQFGGDFWRKKRGFGVSCTEID